MTVFFSVVITLMFMGMAYSACNNQIVECDSHKWPMISDILAMHVYDRVFIFMTTFFMLGVMQVNMRAYYKKVYDYIPVKSNDIILVIGYLACISLPLIGIFDEHEYKRMHCLCAITFFASFSIYALILSLELFHHKNKFPSSEHPSINFLILNCIGLLLVLLGLVVFLVKFGSHSRIGPAFEWLTVFYLTNFYGFMAFVNPFYDSVHKPLSASSLP